MSFVDDNQGFHHWQTTTDTWTNRQGETWHFDINNRAVSQSADGVVSIYPDETGATAWFADILQDNGTGQWPDNNDDQQW